MLDKNLLETSLESLSGQAGYQNSEVQKKGSIKNR